MVYKNGSARLFLLLVAMLSSCWQSTVLADDREDIIASTRELVKQELNPARIGVGYGALMNFSAEPMLSSATYRIGEENGEDPVIYLHKIPIRYEFSLNSSSDRTAFLEANFGYLNMEQNFRLSESAPDKLITSNWKTYSVMVGGGIKMPVGMGFSFAPALHGGIAHLKNDATYYGELANIFFKPTYEGLVFDWSTNAMLLAGTATLGYENTWKSFQFDAKFSYSFNYIDTYNESSSYQVFSTSINVTSAKVDITHPLGISFFDYPLSGVVHAGNSTFVGPNRDALDFSSFNEFGFSLKTNISAKGWLIKSISLGGMGIVGDNVHGWSLLFDYDF